MTKDEAAPFEAQVERVRASGCLGRSHSLTRVFDFLVDAQRSGRPVREADLAHEVFGRNGDLVGDASVRVYVHRLRKKLESFYDGDGVGEARRLTIPLGEYRLDLQGPETPDVKAPLRVGRTGRIALACMGGLLLLNFGAWIALGVGGGADGALRQALHAPVWSMIDGKRPVKLVVGDYYIFGEMGENGVSRMVREFDVNSPDDLQTKLMVYPELQGRYVDLDTTYTATGATEALQFILPVVRAAARDPKRLQLITSSDLTPEMLKTDDIVYVGYLSALRVLEQPLLANSRLKIGSSYDDLIDRKTGRTFDSNAGLAKREAANIDYGYVRAIEGPSGNHLIVVAGTRDIGVLQMAESAVAAPFAVNKRAADGSVEALYEVRGIGRTNISARRVDLDAAR
jgi:hypothetical protein